MAQANMPDLIMAHQTLQSPEILIYRGALDEFSGVIGVE